MALNEDHLDKLEGAIDHLKARGWSRASKASVIRLAIQMLRPDECQDADIALSLCLRREDVLYGREPLPEQTVLPGLNKKPRDA
jgi:hypothetical protein